MAWQWHGMVGMEMVSKWKWLRCNGLEGMTMAWDGKTWHGINRFLGLGLGGSFVSLCVLTQKLGSNVQ
jgi:hypothetical protein